MKEPTIEGFEIGFRTAQESALRRLQELIDTKTPDELDNAIWKWHNEVEEFLKVTHA